jgi:RNA polymerase sigma-70 factor (ECF subfamily)
MVKAGDVDALERITRCYGERLLAVGRRQCRDDDRAQDAVQDALLAAGEHLEDFRGDGSLEGWLVRMVANACHRMRRGRKNDPKLHSVLEEYDSPPAADASPEEGALRGELAVALGDALLRLEPRDRALLLLADGEGWKGPELAESLNMTPGSLRTRLSRARKRLRDELEPVWREYSGA